MRDWTVRPTPVLAAGSAGTEPSGTPGPRRCRVLASSLTSAVWHAVPARPGVDHRPAGRRRGQPARAFSIAGTKLGRSPGSRDVISGTPAAASVTTASSRHSAAPAFRMSVASDAYEVSVAPD